MRRGETGRFMRRKEEIKVEIEERLKATTQCRASRNANRAKYIMALAPVQLDESAIGRKLSGPTTGFIYRGSRDHANDYEDKSWPHEINE